MLLRAKSVAMGRERHGHRLEDMLLQLSCQQLQGSINSLQHVKRAVCTYN